MINANAAPASAATLSTPTQQQGISPAVSAQHMADLLRRYPEVDDAEKLQLVEFLLRGHPDTLAMVTYGAGLVPQAQQVKRDHPAHFQSGWRGLLPWLGFAAAVLLLFALARMI